MTPSPDFDSFAKRYADSTPQVVWTTLVADLETPVSAMLKLAEGRPYSFLLESVTSGEIRGRYSLIGLKPDLVWRCRGDQETPGTTSNISSLSQASRWTNCAPSSPLPPSIWTTIFRPWPPVCSVL